MKKIQIVSFGKIKSPEINSLCDYYQKLASKYFMIEHTVLRDVVERKVDIIDLKELAPSKVILVDENGKNYSTLEFANLVSQAHITQDKITFVIGNAYGFTNEVKTAVPQKISLGSMTTTHELATLILAEQLFRIGNLNSHGKYHKN